MCNSSRYRLRRLILTMGVCALLCPAALCALGAESATAPTIEAVDVGFANQYKLGHWTPVWVTVQGASQPQLVDLELTTPDGDGVPATFLSPATTAVSIPAEQSIRLLAYVKFGRSNAGLDVRLMAAGQALARRVFAQDQLPTKLPVARPLILNLGSPLGLDEAIKQRRQDASQRMINCRIETADRLPMKWYGYDAVHTVVAATSQPCVLEQMDDRQFDAFDRWVKLGGRLILCVGQRGDEVLAADNRLSRFVAGKEPHVIAQRTTAGLENYVGSIDRLDARMSAQARRQGIPMIDMSEVQGRIEASEAGGSSGRLATIVRQPYGLGQVVFVAFDPDQPPFEDWSGRNALMARLLQDASSHRQDATSQGGQRGPIRHLGYHDLTGQLRAALDQFEGVSRVEFSWVAGLVVIYIVLIGPVDYFLLRKMQRMHWTWLSFPLVVILFCGVAYHLANRMTGDRLHINHLDLVDIDVQRGLVRGTAWTHLYSPQTQAFNLQIQAAAPLGLQTTAASQQWLSWQGLPGDGLGGLASTTSATVFTEPYQILHGGETRQSVSEVLEMPIQVSGSKSMVATWWMQHDLAGPTQLSLDRNGLLRGELRSPLNVDLSECMVLYENWAYPLSGSLSPDEVVRFDGLSPKNLEWRLTRRRVINTRDVSTPWDQASLDVARILEVMMFHSAAGGDGYTELTHRYQGHLDLSDHLRSGRAILVGRAEDAASQLMRDGKSLAASCDHHWTWYRIIFPVNQ